MGRQEQGVATCASELHLKCLQVATPFRYQAVLPSHAFSCLLRDALRARRELLRLHAPLLSGLGRHGLRCERCLRLLELRHERCLCALVVLDLLPEFLLRGRAPLRGVRLTRRASRYGVAELSRERHLP